MGHHLLIRNKLQQVRDIKIKIMNNYLIIKAVAGFYYVESGGEIYECKPRGLFRKNKITPLVGDNVEISLDSNDKGTIETILTRKNALVRPPVANIDRIFIVISTTSPYPNAIVTDKLIAYIENSNIDPVIIINKSDLESPDELYSIYKKAGFTTICVSAEEKTGIDEICKLIENKICAFAGNSGVGKSSILNVINSDLNIETSAISDKLGRGKHTTRHVQLYKVCNGYIADTPGFSKFDFQQTQLIHKDNLKFCFREFKDYLTTCKFTSCSHTTEKGCSIIKAVGDNVISQSRHNSYVALYNEASEIPDWEYNKTNK